VVKLGVGFDYPNVSCAILARPTMSEMLFLQQIGRVLRPAEGKTDALVLDHAGNCARHGMPIDCVVHELDDGRKRSANKRKTTVRVYICTGCGYLMEPGQQTCPSCSIDRPTREADVQYLDGDLVAIGSAESGERIYTETDRRHWYYQARAWREHCKSHNPDAAFYAFAEKFGYEPRGWTRRELPYTREVANWNKHYRIRKAKAWVKVQKAKSVDPNHCPACHSKNVEQLPGKGPHSGAIRCEDCGHYRWLARGAA
jgi:RNA polymerase subunit RPABC4/transcription elongation factor Spt4